MRKGKRGNERAKEGEGKIARNYHSRRFISFRPSGAGSSATAMAAASTVRFARPLHSLLSVSHVNSLSAGGPTGSTVRPTGRKINWHSGPPWYTYNACTAPPPECSLPLLVLPSCDGRANADSPGHYQRTYKQRLACLLACWRSHSLPLLAASSARDGKKKPVARPKDAFCTRRLSRSTLGWIAPGITFLSAFTLCPAARAVY